MIPPRVYAATVRQFLAPIVEFLDDPSVSEILINGASDIRIEKAGKIEVTGARFASEDDLLSAIRHVAQFVGKRVSDESPILEGRLPDGSRLQAITQPIAHGGAHVAIRRFSENRLSMGQLVKLGAMSAQLAAQLGVMVKSGKNIIVAGGTGSGKTSLLNALSSFISDGERVLVLEDNRELRLQHPHLVYLEARPADERGRGRVNIRDLFRASLRMRPDRIVIGELRGDEALDLIQAMSSGHGGCLSTLHASSPRQALARLETMALSSDVDLPVRVLRQQISSAVDVLVQTSRLGNGRRVVSQVSEVNEINEKTGRIEIRDLVSLADENSVTEELVCG